jgi:two-component system sensor histidine kinase/response regulator
VLIREQEAEIKVANNWPKVRGYTPWVKSIWSNYISNGIKYGGRPPRLELGADMPGNGMARFWVRDNGPGIPPDELGGLFTRYSRPGTEDRVGYGLGLSIVRRITERLGGSVGAESTPGKGSLFYFELPIAEENIRNNRAG